MILQFLKVTFQWSIDCLKGLQFEILDCKALSHVNVEFNVIQMFSQVGQGLLIKVIAFTENVHYSLKEMPLLKELKIQVHRNACRLKNPIVNHYIF